MSFSHTSHIYLTDVSLANILITSHRLTLITLSSLTSLVYALWLNMLFGIYNMCKWAYALHNRSHICIHLDHTSISCISITSSSPHPHHHHNHHHNNTIPRLARNWHTARLCPSSRPLSVNHRPYSAATHNPCAALIHNTPTPESCRPMVTHFDTATWLNKQVISCNSNNNIVQLINDFHFLEFII